MGMHSRVEPINALQLGFVGIGLTTNIPKMLRQLKGGKEVAHYLVGQTFNICVTLLFAWLMFDVV
jgi:hypothetical protein